MPLLPPVMSAIFPSSLPMYFSLVRCSLRRPKTPGHAEAMVTLITHDGATGFRAEVACVKKGQAALPGATHKTRRSDNRHWAQPSRDAARVAHRVSVAEAGYKNGFRQARSF